MKKLSVALVLVAALAQAQPAAPKAGATVFIAPDGGGEFFLTAAFAKKGVPLVVVQDPTKAEYRVESIVAGSDPSGIDTRISISVVDVRSSGVVFAYSAHTTHGEQRAAEDGAKAMKGFMGNR